MSWLESLGLLGLFLGTFLAATIVPFSSDALYVAVLMATHNPVGCLVVGTLGNWLGSVTTYWIGRIGRWEWIERWFKVSPEAMERQKKESRPLRHLARPARLGAFHRRRFHPRPRLFQNQARGNHALAPCRQVPPFSRLELYYWGAVALKWN